jgi:nucleoside-triphosphatase
MRIFLTGSPGIGKTTLIRAVVKRLEEVSCARFYTEEKRQRGQRVGFRILTLMGQEGNLASVGRTEPAVGRYSVHIDEFENLVLPNLDPETTPAELYVIDEIGKMELLSSRFRNRIIDLLAQPTNLLATIAKKGQRLIDQLKARNDIDLIEVTRANRNELPEEIARKIKTEIRRF